MTQKESTGGFVLKNEEKHTFKSTSTETRLHQGNIDSVEQVSQSSGLNPI